MLIRKASATDAGALAGIFYRAVQIGAAEVYDAAQRRVWCDVQPDAKAWGTRLEGLLTLVAEQDGVPVGFMSMRMADGYLDLAFVEPNRRGTGVAGDIYAVLENRARAAGLTRLHSHASIMAKRFFERHGWQVVRAKPVERGGVTLDNWVMEKTLDARPKPLRGDKNVETSAT